MGNLSADLEPAKGDTSSGKAPSCKASSGKAPSTEGQQGKIFSREALSAEETTGTEAPAEKNILQEFVFTENLSRNLAVFCSDERFIDASMAFLKNTLYLKKFDLIVTAGGPAFITADVPVLMGNLSLLKEVHNISTLVLISHEDCKYYAKKFGNIGGNETIKCQQKDLQDAKQKLLKLYPGLRVEIYFARIAGSKIIFENKA
jgi:hypothetical protein